MVELRKLNNYKESYHQKIKEAIFKDIPDISKENSKIIIQYVQDMEKGLNISNGSKKGSRSYSRLNALMNKLIFLSKLFQEKIHKNLIDLNEEDLHNVFTEMRTGKIKKRNGEQYRAVRDYVKDFKSFWHYYMRVMKKKNKEIVDITQDLDTSKEKPGWVYLSEEDFKKLANKSNFKYRVLMWFLYDTGIRTPKECFNIKVSDFINDFKELNIRNETSKTFGRRIKLMLCNGLIKEYVNQESLKQEDYLFNFSPIVATRYIKRIAESIFKNKESLAGKKYKNIILYDFRHSSACYWLPRYKSISALLYRFGWKKEEEIHYYSEFLGMKDTISEEDLLIDLTKTEIEKQLIKAQQERDLITESNEELLKKFKKLNEKINRVERMQKVMKL